MGMSRRQCFWQIQLPLALPPALRSLRVVAVQTVGMAVIAALIGAGGFGALVFQAAEQRAGSGVTGRGAHDCTGGRHRCAVCLMARVAREKSQ